MRTGITLSATVALIFGIALLGHTQEQDESRANAHAPRTSKHYFLPATPENVQWGWYDPKMQTAFKPGIVIDLKPFPV